MSITPGILLKSTGSLSGTFFEDSIILITEHNEKGAVGFVINKRFERSLNELTEFRHSPSFPLYDGGPVGQELLYFIHQCPGSIHGGAAIADGVFYSGDFKQAVTAINNKSISPADIKIFIGYCGWDAGELEAEIAEGSWEVIKDVPLFS